MHYYIVVHNHSDSTAHEFTEFLRCSPDVQIPFPGYLKRTLLMRLLLFRGSSGEVYPLCDEEVSRIVAQPHSTLIHE